ncbi:MAG: hypothetical protein Tsb005_14520 [Gammaproteobacteria bacterium]
MKKIKKDILESLVKLMQAANVMSRWQQCVYRMSLSPAFKQVRHVPLELLAAFEIAWPANLNNETLTTWINMNAGNQESYSAALRDLAWFVQSNLCQNKYRYQLNNRYLSCLWTKPITPEYEKLLKLLATPESYHVKRRKTSYCYSNFFTASLAVMGASLSMVKVSYGEANYTISMGNWVDVSQQVGIHNLYRSNLYAFTNNSYTLGCASYNASADYASDAFYVFDLDPYGNITNTHFLSNFVKIGGAPQSQLKMARDKQWGVTAIDVVKPTTKNITLPQTCLMLQPSTSTWLVRNAPLTSACYNGTGLNYDLSGLNVIGSDIVSTYFMSDLNSYKVTLQTLSVANHKLQTVDFNLTTLLAHSAYIKSINSITAPIGNDKTVISTVTAKNYLNDFNSVYFYDKENYVYNLPVNTTEFYDMQYNQQTDYYNVFYKKLAEDIDIDDEMESLVLAAIEPETGALLDERILSNVTVNTAIGFGRLRVAANGNVLISYQRVQDGCEELCLQLFSSAFEPLTELVTVHYEMITGYYCFISSLALNNINAAIALECSNSDSRSKTLFAAIDFLENSENSTAISNMPSL